VPTSQYGVSSSGSSTCTRTAPGSHGRVDT
jgi:hypothetical protein